MLYDPKWEKTETKAEPSLAGLVAWLETKNPRKKYQWAGCEPCLIEQYVHSLGMSSADLFGPQDKNGDSLYDRLSTNNDGLACSYPHTFGGALRRARAALSSTHRDGD